MADKVVLLRQKIDRVTLDDVLQFIDKQVKQKKSTAIFAMNLHVLVELQKNILFEKVHQGADLVFADGVIVLWLSKLYGHPLKKRVSGTDLVEKLLHSKQKVFLLGSTENELHKISEKFPKQVAGIYAPPFVSVWSAKEKEKIRKLIQKSAAKIVLVGVGVPKQEMWITEELSKTGAIVGIGVGSAFDILSGKTPRAPWLLKDHGFEWLWRVMLEPGRLWKRYLVDGVEIIKLMVRK